jgi:hypothetical protein
MGEMGNVYKGFVGNQKGNGHFEDLDVDERIQLKSIFKIRMGECGLDSSVSGQEPLPGSCEHRN